MRKAVDNVSFHDCVAMVVLLILFIGWANLVCSQAQDHSVNDQNDIKVGKLALYKPINGMGAPFRVGMLFDARTSSIVPGVSLWESNKIAPNNKTGSRLEYRLTPDSRLSLDLLDTIRDKFHLIDVKGYMKMNVMSGATKLSGHVLFLKSDRDSNTLNTLYLNSITRTHFQQLRMAELTPAGIDYPDVFSKKIATHVVTGIQYGADATFKFSSLDKLTINMIAVNVGLAFNYTKQAKQADDNKVKEDSEETDSLDKEDSEDEHGKSEAKKKAPVQQKGVQNVAMSVNVTFNRTKFDNHTNITVTFIGDYFLDANPTTAFAALNVYKDLNDKLRIDKELYARAMPKEIYLLPLEKLSERETQFLSDISQQLVVRTESLFITYQQYIRKCGDLQAVESVKVFPTLESDVIKFRTRLVNFWQKTSGEIANLLPSIRGRGKEEISLINLLDNVERSPFSEVRMKRFTKYLTVQSQVLSAYYSNMNRKSIRAALNPGVYHRLRNDVSYDLMVSFMFRVFKRKDPLYLRLAQEYITMVNTGDAGGKRQHQMKIDVLDSYSRLNWYENVSISVQMAQGSRRFCELADSNSLMHNVVFLIGMDLLEKNETAGYRLRLYEDGFWQQNFEFSGAPTKVKVEMSSGRPSHVTISWHQADNWSSAPDGRIWLPWGQNVQVNSSHLEKYVVQLRVLQNGRVTDWQTVGEVATNLYKSGTTFSMEVPTVPNTHYQVTVYGKHPEFHHGVRSKPVDYFAEEILKLDVTQHSCRSVLYEAVMACRQSNNNSEDLYSDPHNHYTRVARCISTVIINNPSETQAVLVAVGSQDGFKFNTNGDETYVQMCTVRKGLIYTIVTLVRQIIPRGDLAQDEDCTVEGFMSDPNPCVDNKNIPDLDAKIANLTASNLTDLDEKLNKTLTGGSHLHYASMYARAGMACRAFERPFCQRKLRRLENSTTHDLTSMVDVMNLGVWWW